MGGEDITMNERTTIPPELKVELPLNRWETSDGRLGM